MSTTEVLVRLAVGVVLTGLNAFFVTTEFALTRLRQLPEERFRDDRRLRRAWEMTRRLEIYLTGCQLGITSTTILLGVIAEPAVTALLRPLWSAVGLEGATAATASVIAAVVVINLVHKIWGEQAPTYLGVERPLQVARWAATPHYWWTKVMYPFIKLGDGAAKLTLRAVGVEMSRSWVEEAEGGEEPGADEAVGRPDSGSPAPRGAGEDGRSSRSDLRRQMGEILSRGGVDADRREEVIRALEISSIPVARIMVPAERVVALAVHEPLEENLARIRAALHSRFPLVGRSLEDYRGALHVPSILAHIEELKTGEVELAALAAEPLEVAPELPVADLIDFLQAREQELALVREGDAVRGLVTVTDALEAIIGDLRDPLDREVEQAPDQGADPAPDQDAEPGPDPAADPEAEPR